MHRNRATANEPNGSGFRRQRQTRPTSRYDSEEAAEHYVHTADLNKMKLSSLKKYVRVHDIQGAHPMSSREDLLALVQRHYGSQVVDETTTLEGLIIALKSEKTQQYNR